MGKAMKWGNVGSIHIMVHGIDEKVNRHSHVSACRHGTTLEQQATQKVPVTSPD